MMVDEVRCCLGWSGGDGEVRRPEGHPPLLLHSPLSEGCVVERRAALEDVCQEQRSDGIGKTFRPRVRELIFQRALLGVVRWVEERAPSPSPQGNSAFTHARLYRNTHNTQPSSTPLLRPTNGCHGVFMRRARRRGRGGGAPHAAAAAARRRGGGGRQGEGPGRSLGARWDEEREEWVCGGGGAQPLRGCCDGGG